jgi:hypothetical protein
MRHNMLDKVRSKVEIEIGEEGKLFKLYFKYV